jgi:chromosome segregation protein
VRDLVVRLETLEPGDAGQGTGHDRLEVQIAELRGRSAGQYRARVEAELALATRELELQAIGDEMSERAEGLEMEIAALKGRSAGQHRARVEAELALATRELDEKAFEDQVSGRTEGLEMEIAALKGRSAGQHRARVEAELALATGELELQQTRAELLSLRNARRIRPEETGSDAVEALAERDLRVAELQAQAQAARWRVAELEARNQDLEARLDAPGTENDRSAELKARLEAQSQRFAELQRSAKIFEDEADQHRNLVGSLEKELLAAKNRTSAFEQEVTAAAETRTHLENELAKLGAQLENVEHSATSADEQVSEEKIRADQAEERLLAATRELEGAKSKISSLGLALEQAEAAVRQELAEELENARKLAAQVLSQEERLETSSRQLVEESSRCEALLGTVQSLRNELDNELDRTRLAGADAARYAGEKDDFQHKLANYRQGAEEQELALKASQRALTALRDEVASLERKDKGALEARVAEKEETVRLLSQVKRLSELKNKLASTQSEFASVRNNSEALAEELNDSQQLLRKAEERLGVAGEAQVAASEQVADAMLAEERAEKEILQVKRELEAVRGNNEKENKRLALELEAARQETKKAERKVLKSERPSPDQDPLFKSLTSQLEEKVQHLKKVQQEVLGLTRKNEEQESLFKSLTVQLEEREQRATKLARQVKEFEDGAKGHGSDVAAWEMELKFSNSRVSTLEAQLAKLQESLTSESLSKQAATRRVSQPAIEPEVNADELRAQIEQLNDNLGDKDAKLFVLTSQVEDSRRRLLNIQSSLKDLLGKDALQEEIGHRIQEILESIPVK